MPILNMNHTAFLVKDVNASFHFYHDVLNIPIVRLVGPESNPQIVFLQGLELTQMKQENGNASFDHIGLEVSNIEEVYERLSKNGIVFDAPIKDVILEVEKKAVKIAYFSDPDGNKVELVEWRNL